MKQSPHYADHVSFFDRTIPLRPSYILGRNSRPRSTEQLPRVGSRSSFETPNFSKKYDAERVLNKRMGVTADQVKREQALRRLGLTEDDLARAQEIRAVVPKAVETSINPTKEEQLTGYTAEQLQRRKALDVLGVTEDYLDEQVSKDLGSLGLGARKRSFAHRDNVDDFIRARIEALQRSSSRDLAALGEEEDEARCLPRNPSPERLARGRSAPNEGRRASIKQAIKEIFGGGTFDGEPSYGELWLLYHATLDRKEELEHDLAFTRQAVRKLSQFITRLGYDPAVILTDDDDEDDALGLRTVNEFDVLEETTSGTRVSPITTPETTARKALK